MTAEPGTGAGRRSPRILLFGLATLSAGYAISDDPFYGGIPGFGAAQIGLLTLGVLLAFAVLLPVRWVERVLLLALGSGLALAAVELLGEPLLAPRYRPIYQLDDELIFGFIPDRSSETVLAPENGSRRVSHRINAQGFRGEDLDPTRLRPRVVVYGDSFIHAAYCPEEETFRVQLRRRLESDLKQPVEVVNAGVSSYGPDQISLKMERELPVLRPDLVIVAVFAGNDYGDLLRNKLYRLTPEGELIRNTYVLDPALRARFELNQRESILMRVIRSASRTYLPRSDEPSRNKLAPHESMDFWLAEAEREYVDYVVNANDLVTNTHEDYYSADVSLLPNSGSARYQVAFMGQVLKRIDAVARAADVPLVLLFIPHLFDVTDDHSGIRVDRDRFPDYDGRNQVGPLEQAAMRFGIRYVSLFDTYRDRDADLLYLHGRDDHWNALGQAIAADSMAAFLDSHGLLGGLTAARARRGLVTP